MLMVAPVMNCRRTSLSLEENDILRSDPNIRAARECRPEHVPAITHVDYSARLQTVDERHGRYHRLLKAFHALQAARFS